jgi:UPF0176 protein
MYPSVARHLCDMMGTYVLFFSGINALDTRAFRAASLLSLVWYIRSLGLAERVCACRQMVLHILPFQSRDHPLGAAHDPYPIMDSCPTIVPFTSRCPAYLLRFLHLYAFAIVLLLLESKYYMDYQVLLFYKYVTIVNPQELKETYLALCEKYELKGRTILASEGINSTLEGTIENTEKFLEEFLQDSRFTDIHIKRSKGDGSSFPRLSVKVRNEIVGTRFPKEIDPRIQTAPHMTADELHALYEKQEDFIIVDMRNSYEYASGHFENSIDPGMDASRQLPEVLEKLDVHDDKKIVTVCTGGVRCEKMAAYLVHKGFKNVHQLDGGMHTYMEKYPEGHFKGTLFTFDDRLVMDFGGNREIIGKCKRCEAPNEQYQNCANAECNMLFLICNECMSAEGPGFCSEKCEKSTARVVQRVRGKVTV